MYRIHFDPNTSMFVVQFLVWGFFWQTCHARCDEPVAVKLQFETYAEACKWVSDKGIPEAYEVQPKPRTLYTTAPAR